MTSCVYIMSLGCEKNLVDSERALGTFRYHGFETVSDPRAAHVIMVNTCGFIGSAIEESIDAIVALAQYKKIGVCQYLVVTGCLAQRFGQELPDEFPEVDVFLGTRDYPKLHELIPVMQQGKPLSDRVIAISSPYFRKDQKNTSQLMWEDALPRAPSGLVHTGYVKISEGCNKRCTFCTIPLIRGDLVSRALPSVISEIQSLEATGLKELHLIAQDLNDYGIEWPDGPHLEDLLEAILRDTHVAWIRLHYLYPDRISDRLLGLLATEPRLCQYVDMPIQHISDPVLRRMGRKHNRRQTEAIISRLYQRMPNLSLRTTLITGFPGETLEDHAVLVRFLEEGWIEHLGVFPYFHESHSASYRLTDDVSAVEKKRRKKELEVIQSQIMEQRFREKYVGRTWLCVVDGPYGKGQPEHVHKGRLFSQAYGVDSHVKLFHSYGVKQGDIVPVDILGVEEGNLMGHYSNQAHVQK